MCFERGGEVPGDTGDIGEDQALNIKPSHCWVFKTMTLRDLIIRLSIEKGEQSQTATRQPPKT